MRPITLKYLIIKTVVQVWTLTLLLFIAMTLCRMQGDTHFGWLVD